MNIMKRYLSAFTGACIASLFFGSAAVAQLRLPDNPQTSDCSLDLQEFSTWIDPNHRSAFEPANSIAFPPYNNTKCDFYKWSAQMFLWATSTSSQYGGSGNFVFDSPVFFDVSPAINNKRTLISSELGNDFALRAGKFDELIGETGQAGGGDALISQASTDASNASSLVYYGIHVNDVYAYFLKGQKDPSKPFHPVRPPNPSAPPMSPELSFPNAFPIWPAELQQVVNYARTQGRILQDADALTMELKTSWIDANTVKNPSQYLIIDATVPNYIMEGDKIWKIDQMLPAVRKRLALVGMHVVGTVQGHPEMVWATYEHVNNAPDVTYEYTNAQGVNQTAGGSANNGFLFNSNSMANANIARLKNCNSKSCAPTDIVHTENETIGPSNTTRLNPWGSIGKDAPNNTPNETGVANNNAQLISLNNDVIRFLPGGDARRNYVLSGAVWTLKGGIPVFNDPVKSGNPAEQKGSLSLANTTMETYHQLAYLTNDGCFSCHALGSKSDVGVKVSHIFEEIIPQWR
jgi:hypothetical protein